MYRSRVAKSVYLGMSLHTRTKLRPPRKRVSNLFAEQKHSRILWPLKPRRRHRSWLLWLVSLGKYEWVPLLWQNTDSPRLASPCLAHHVYVFVTCVSERSAFASEGRQRYRDTKIQRYKCKHNQQPVITSRRLGPLNDAWLMRRWEINWICEYFTDTSVYNEPIDTSFPRKKKQFFRRSDAAMLQSGRHPNVSFVCAFGIGSNASQKLPSGRHPGQ